MLSPLCEGRLTVTMIYRLFCLLKKFGNGWFWLLNFIVPVSNKEHCFYCILYYEGDLKAAKTCGYERPDNCYVGRKLGGNTRDHLFSKRKQRFVLCVNHMHV